MKDALFSLAQSWQQLSSNLKKSWKALWLSLFKQEDTTGQDLDDDDLPLNIFPSSVFWNTLTNS